MSAAHLRRHGVSASGWSLAGLALCLAAEAATVAIALGPAQEPGDVRWPLVALPLLAAAAPIVVASRGVRIAAAAVVAFWCVLAAASVGLFFVPSLLALIAAARGGRV